MHTDELLTSDELVDLLDADFDAMLLDDELRDLAESMIEPDTDLSLVALALDPERGRGAN
jgi:hypothetical protein